MKSVGFASMAAGFLIAGCSGSTTGGGTGAPSSLDAGDEGQTPDPGPSDAAAQDVALAAPTWTNIYTTYFAAGTPGHCAHCHDQAFGATKDSFYQGLVDNQLIDPAHPASSWLIDPQQSKVIWFNASGTMPKDNVAPNAQAKADITAWIEAGAQNN